MNRLILIIFSISLVIGQYNQDARMLGMSGAYTNVAEGFSCVGINPANLSYGTNYSMNISSFNTGFWNNMFYKFIINNRF